MISTKGPRHTLPGCIDVGTALKQKLDCGPRAVGRSLGKRDMRANDAAVLVLLVFVLAHALA
jgi:hypothetical protein